MKRVHFKIGKFGHKDVVYVSHIGNDWYRNYPVEQLRYWIDYYLSDGYEVLIKNN